MITISWPTYPLHFHSFSVCSVYTCLSGNLPQVAVKSNPVSAHLHPTSKLCLCPNLFAAWLDGSLDDQSKKSPIMRLPAAIALLSVSAWAAKLSPGEPCGTNVDCDSKCLDRKWTISPDTAGTDLFVCDPDTVDLDQYYRGRCQITRTYDVVFSEDVYDPTSTAKACKSMDGTMCKKGCVFSRKRTADADTRATWAAACKSYGGTGPAELIDFTEKEAKFHAGCAS